MEIEKDIDSPNAYLITFRTYGTWLHGDVKGSVDRQRNQFDTTFCPNDLKRQNDIKNRMRYSPYLLNDKQRKIVLASITDMCLRKQWELYAAHIRCNHVHCVLTASCPVERTLVQLKANASRLLNASNCDPIPRKRWIKHGSTRYLWKAENVLTAIHYVVEQQGEPMALYKNDSVYRELCESINILE